jgi:hypothetical protein
VPAEVLDQILTRLTKLELEARIGHNGGPPLSMLLDSQVLTFAEWCRLNRFSKRNGRRILSSGKGPIVTQLSARRIGVTIGNDRAWKASRERT